MIVIVPEHVRRAIDAKIDEFIADGNTVVRQQLFDDMLAIYDKHGEVPDIVVK